MIALFLIENGIFRRQKVKVFTVSVIPFSRNTRNAITNNQKINTFFLLQKTRMSRSAIFNITKCIIKKKLKYTLKVIFLLSIHERNVILCGSKWNSIGRHLQHFWLDSARGSIFTSKWLWSINQYINVIYNCVF